MMLAAVFDKSMAKKIITQAAVALLIGGNLLGCAPEQSENENSSIEDSTAESAASISLSAESANLDTMHNRHKMVTIGSARGPMTLPTNPHPVAVYDMTIMQDLSALGVPMDGLPNKLLLDNLKAPNTPEAQNIGTIFEPDMEMLNAMQPKAILIGGRMASKYDTLMAVAPTVDLSLDTNHMYDSSKQRLADLGKLFAKSAKANQLQQDIDVAIAKAKSASAGKGNGLMIMVNGNKLSAFGESSRFGYLHTVFGIPVADSNIEDATHGQPVSFEYVQKVNPDWLFVLDRTSAVGKEGVGAKEVLNNSLVHKTKAWQNDHIVYLSPDSYLAYGGYYQWIKDAKAVAEAMQGAPALK